MLGNETHDEALFPEALHVVGGEYEDAVEPLPEGEAPVWQGLLAEEGPGQHQIVVLFRLPRQVVVSGKQGNLRPNQE